MKKIAAGLLAIAATAAAHAAPYAELALGQTSVADLDCTGATTCKDKPTSFRLTGGWQYNANLAAELSYVSFGTARAADATDSVSAKARGFGIGAAATLPLGNQLGLVGRLGLMSVRTSATATSGAVSGSTATTKTKPYLGVGVTYDLNKAIGLGLNYDTTKAEIAGLKSDLNTLSLSAKYRF